MMLIQILLVIFALFALLKVIQRFRVSEVSGQELLGWIIFWVAVIVVAVLPNTASFLAELSGVGRGADLVVYLSLALLFYSLFRLNVRLEKIERNLTKVTRQEALSNSEKK